MFWPFTVWINCSSDLKNFANSRPSASKFKSFCQSLEQFFLTVGQNNFGNKIPFLSQISTEFSIQKCHYQTLYYTVYTLPPHHLSPSNTNKSHQKGLDLSSTEAMAIRVVEYGGTKLERFLPKNQHTQTKLLNFEFWINGQLSKNANIWLSKSSKSFSIFFSLKI